MRAKPFLIGCFAAIAVVAGWSIYMSATVDRAQRTIDAVLSPDGKFKAVRTTLAAGGAVPFCLDNIAVRLSIYPDNFDEHKSAYEVYAGPCGRVAGRNVSPTLEWLSNTALQITVAPHAGADAKTIRMKDTDITNAVHVTVVERE